MKEKDICWIHGIDLRLYTDGDILIQKDDVDIFLSVDDLKELIKMSEEFCKE